MASKNSIKIYAEDSFYHLYNRGVEKRRIFEDNQDYAVYLSYLKNYLLPKNEKELYKKLSDPNTSYKERDTVLGLLRMNNFHEEITLCAYCLMPNHFHLLIKQKSAGSIDKFMNSLCVRYVMYFNKKYKRVGRLFQDVYKAVLVASDEQLLYLSSYIHRNPLLKNLGKLASEDDLFRALFSKPSSLPEYLGQRNAEWVHPEEILTHFSKTNPNLSYEAFVKQTEDLSVIGNLTIDF